MDVLHRIIGGGERTDGDTPAERLTALETKYAPVLSTLRERAVDVEWEIHGGTLVVRAIMTSESLREDVQSMAARIDENGHDLELHLHVRSGGPQT